LRSELRSKSVAVDLDLSADAPLVHGDRVQLQQVILNLVKNAIESMSDQPPDGRRLRLTTRRTAHGGSVTTVEDSGGGLDATAASRIFEPFFTTKSDGMGLGLAICESIVQAHGGRLWMSTREPHGCIFQFELPPLGEFDRSATKTALDVARG
jgi:C4-dicarboxylate-specific signal transduction histidine kinase